MNTAKQKLALWTSTAAALSVAAVSALAQESKPREQPILPASAARLRIDATAYLKPDYVDSVKPADFLEGNKISGSFGGFAGDFAKFSRKDSKEEIFIPNSAILYMTAETKVINVP
jgi:hypothetical protein